MPSVEIPVAERSRAARLAHVRLSTGRIISGREDVDLPESGYVAGRKS